MFFEKILVRCLFHGGTSRLPASPKNRQHHPTVLLLPPGSDSSSSFALGNVIAVVPSVVRFVSTSWHISRSQNSVPAFSAPLRLGSLHDQRTVNIIHRSVSHLGAVTLNVFLWVRQHGFHRTNNRSRIHSRRVLEMSIRCSGPNQSFNPDAASIGSFLRLSFGLLVPSQRAAVGTAG